MCLCVVFASILILRLWGMHGSLHHPMLLSTYGTMENMNFNQFNFYVQYNLVDVYCMTTSSFCQHIRPLDYPKAQMPEILSQVIHHCAGSCALICLTMRLSPSSRGEEKCAQCVSEVIVKKMSSRLQSLIQKTSSSRWS